MLKPLDSYYQFETDRLRFRPIEKSDIEHWLPFFDNNPSLRFLGMGASPYKDLSSLEKCMFWLNRQMDRKLKGQYGQLAVIEKDSGKFIGVAGLIYRNEMGVENELEVTYSLLPDFHGRGYGTEAAKGFMNFAFNNVGLQTVISIIHQENSASINIAEKNGLSPDFQIDDYMGMPVIIYRKTEEPSKTNGSTI